MPSFRLFRRPLYPLHRHLSTPHSQPTNSNSPQAPPATRLPPTPVLPPTPPLLRAQADLQSLRELHQSRAATSPADTVALLTRALHIFPSHPLHAALLHASLARVHHLHASLAPERHHRLAAASALDDAARTPDPDSAAHAALASMSRVGLALACLRAPGDEARLAAGAAAADGARQVGGAPLRMAAALAAALAAEPRSRSMVTMLSALVAVDAPGGAAAPLDVPGFARLFLALHGGEDKAADHAKALVVRWEVRGGFDLVEALCVAAEKVGGKDAEMAEDMLGRALRMAGEMGNDLDKSEPLLGLARLYEQKGRMVEAEGLYRSVEERFERVREKRAFTVSAAEVYCRGMRMYASFLERVEMNGVSRAKEGTTKRERAAEVRAMFPDVLGEGEEDPCVPLWVVDSMLPHFELPEPLVQEVSNEDSTT